MIGMSSDGTVSDLMKTKGDFSYAADQKNH